LGRPLERFWSWILSGSLVLVPSQAISGERKIDPLAHHILVNLALDEVFANLAKVHTVKDFEKVFVSRLLPRDQPAMTRLVRQMNEMPKIERLNRGFSYQYAGRKMVVVHENIGWGRYSVNGVSWTFDPTAPLEMQAEILSQKLEKTKTSLNLLFFPRANAGAAVGVIVGVATAVIIVPLFEWARSQFTPKFTEYSCNDKNENTTDYVTFKRCEEYFKFMQGVNARATREKIDKAAPLENNKSKDRLPSLSNQRVCPDVKKKQSIFQAVIMDEITKAEALQTIEYEGAMPTQMTTAPVSKPSVILFTYELDSQGKLYKVVGRDGTYLSRDPKDEKLMTGEKVKAMQMFEKHLVYVSDIQENSCNLEKAKSTAAVVNAASNIPIDELQKLESDPSRKSMPLMPDKKTAK
jgi:hypothetical protein